MHPKSWYRLSLFWFAPPLLLLSQPALIAQTLRLSSASAIQGSRVAIEISLESPAGKEPAALQWSLTVPADQLTMEGPLVIGAAAKEAGKSIRCGEARKSTAGNTVACIISGGREVIPNGVVGTLMLKISAKATPGAAHVHVEHALAVSKDSREIALKAAETVVTIRAR